MHPDHERTTVQRSARPSRLSVALLLAGLTLLSTLAPWLVGAAAPLALPMMQSTPAVVGGHGQSSDGRNDIDIYPSVAFDAASQRYLAVWMSTRRADSSGDGFDVFGKFIDAQGLPLGTEFQISDQNNVARSGKAAVVAGPNGFLVVWASSAGRCRLTYQLVNDSAPRTDALLLATSAHNHSPSLVYNPQRGRYLLAYVEGDDYLPPKLFGAATGTCGDNAASSSAARALEFQFVNGVAEVTGEQLLSEANGGAFRPSLAWNDALNQYLIVWEDRRNASGQLHRFDVFSQALNPDLSRAGSNLPIQTGVDYTNLDESATWTPRPAVAAGQAKFLIAWYARQAPQGIPLWSLNGRFMTQGGALSAPFTVAQMTFAGAHPGSAPSGFIDLLYNETSQEYTAALTSQLESAFGYFSTLRLQRIDASGGLLRMNGSTLPAPGVGTAIDYDYDSQISAALARQEGNYRGEMIVVYGKHAPNRQSEDFDIWSVQSWYNVSQPPTPTATPTATREPTLTVTPQPTQTATVTPTPTQAPQSNALYLPAVQRARR